MKRLIIFTAVIALLAVAVFGGQTLADKPEQLPTNQAMVNAIESGLANVTMMERDSGCETVSTDQETIIMDYGPITPDGPQTRHVSLTMYAGGIDHPDDKIYINVWYREAGIGPLLDEVTTNGTKMYEFDSDMWHIDIRNAGGDPIKVCYRVTSTYPR